MKLVPTYTATIYVGTREQYTDAIRSPEMAEQIIQQYVDEVRLCVTVTHTRFIYVKGSEPGVIVGLINYPRFPTTPAAIREKALRLAAILMDAFHQLKVTVVFPDETVMLESTAAALPEAH